MVGLSSSSEAYTAFKFNNLNWQVADAQGQRIDELGFDDDSALNMIAIAPDGRSFAFSQYGAVIIWHNGETMIVPPSGAEYSGEQPYVAWGYVIYRIRSIQ